MMEIRIAELGDKPHITKYDRHVPDARLDICIRDSQVMVLCDNGNIIGVLRWSLFWQTIPFVDLLYVDGAYQNRGLGRNMMAHWEKAMAEMGYSAVMLSTQADETAKFFYEKIGYRKICAFLPPEQEADELMYLKELK